MNPSARWCVAVAAVTLAGAAEPQARASEPALLPPGIHLGSGGRYMQDVCDHSLPSYCLSHRLLPVDFDPAAIVPAREPRPRFGGQFCVPMQTAQGGALPPPGSMTPADVVAAYALPASSAAHGQIVAVVDMPDSTAFADLTKYRAQFGLPALPWCAGGLPDGKTPCFAQVDAAGTPNSTSLDCPGADPETGLDMEMVSAACPDCSILVVQMTNATSGPSYPDFTQAVQTAAQLGAVATSISFGIPEQGGEPTTFSTPGHLVIAASGDAGYLNVLVPQIGGHSPSYPASAPDVLGVGGTELVALGGGSYGEKVWNDGTGGADSSGCSTEFPMPSFQTSFLASHAGAFGACTQRDSVDLSAAADFAGTLGEAGIAEFDSLDQWAPVVGTSAASPLVAGIFTRLGLAKALSADLGFPYANIAAFNDVTEGNDIVGNACPDMNCTAGLGWDGPTGVGTPNGAKLALLVPSGSGSGSGSSSGAPGTDGGGAADTTAKAGCGCATLGSERSPFEALSLLAMGTGAVVLGRRRGARRAAPRVSSRRAWL
jgi:hypothetical protein